MATGPTIVAKFIADTKGLTTDVDKMTSKAGGKLSGFAKTAAGSIGGAFAAGAIVDMGKKSVDAAAADAEAQGKLATTLRNVAGATDAQIAASEDYIGNLSRQTAIADDDLRPAMDNLVRGFGNAEDAQKALALATDISAGTGKDLGSVSEMLMKAANGQTGSLRKLGIETTNADGSAKSLNEIMQDTADTFGGQAAAAADTTAGKMRGAQIAMGELQETIGAGLLPIIGQLAGLLERILPTIAQFAPIILPLAIAFGIWSAAVSVATTVQAAFGVTLGISVGWIALIVVAVAALVAGIIWAYNNVGWFRDIVQTAFGAVSVAFGWVTAAAKKTFDWVKQNWPLLLAIITGPIGAAVYLIQQNWDTIKQGATDVWLWITGKFQAVADFLTGFVSTIAGVVGDIADAMRAPINAIIDAWNGLSFTIPRISTPKIHVPGTNVDIGGEIFGGKTWDLPNLPRLAGGGVLTGPTLFLGGEGGETEIVSPESMLRAIMREESGGGGYVLNIYPRTADAADVAYGFRRLELLAGVT